MEEMGEHPGGSCITSRFPIANISGDEGSQYTYCQALEQLQDGLDIKPFYRLVFLM